MKIGMVDGGSVFVDILRLRERELLVALGVNLANIIYTFADGTM